VKPAALITRLNPHDKTLPKPAFELSEAKLDPAKAAARKKPAPRVRAKRAVAKPGKPAAKKEVAKRWVPKSKLAGARAGGKSEGKKPAQSAVVAHSGGPKPSPAISKQSPGSN
jgi:hypothetical protein